MENNDNKLNWAKHLGIGFELTGLVGFAAFLGYYLDKKFNTSPILMFLIVLLTFIFWIVKMIRTFNK